VGRERAFAKGRGANRTSEITQWKPTFYSLAVTLPCFEEALTFFLSE
jgi:hypothetical protein